MCAAAYSDGSGKAPVLCRRRPSRDAGAARHRYGGEVFGRCYRRDADGHGGTRAGKSGRHASPAWRLARRAGRVQHGHVLFDGAVRRAGAGAGDAQRCPPDEKSHLWGTFRQSGGLPAGLYIGHCCVRGGHGNGRCGIA